MMRRRIVTRGAHAAAVAAAVVIAVAAAGCGSSSSGAGRAAAAKARSQVVSATRALYQDIYRARVGWATSLSGLYLGCPTSTNQDELMYRGVISYIDAFNRRISSGAYRGRLISLVHSGGWTYTENTRDAPAGSWAFHYDLVKGPMRGDVSIGGPTALLRVSSPCFDAGAAAQSLGQHGDELPLPHPSRPPPAGSASPSPSGS
jgi:hypothetical protein